MVDKAKELCEDLLENVKEQYEEFKTRPPRQHYSGGHGGHGGYNNHGRSGSNADSYGGGGGGYGGGYRDSPGRGGGNSASPAPGGSATPSNAADPYQQYAQYYAAQGQDPYAAYGGYAA